MPTILTCAYCGMEYPEGTESSGVKLLSDHIRICEKHPLRKTEMKIKKLDIFKDMVDEYEKGRPVTKLCYGLTNDHMEALKNILKE